MIGFPLFVMLGGNFSRLKPDVPEELRGTYAGLASDASLRYLTELGVTAVELLPIHYFLEDRHLIERGLSNYWGYNTLGFFAPTRKYCVSGTAADSVREFKAMVKTLHAAGLEVILDVVYNHTAEGNQLGPTLVYRGLDNAGYYRLVAGDERHYMDYTGCGNTLNMLCPHVLQLIMDSLRSWVTEMHVDGFRFDLASALARELHEVDKLGAFFDIIHQDPILSQVKLIAEPWDIGPGGYQVGNFPIGWTEWNGKYRDCVRKFWKGDGGTTSAKRTGIFRVFFACKLARGKESSWSWCISKAGGFAMTTGRGQLMDIHVTRYYQCLYAADGGRFCAARDLNTACSGSKTGCRRSLSVSPRVSAVSRPGATTCTSWCGWSRTPQTGGLAEDVRPAVVGDRRIKEFTDLGS